jgi:hypothetical protein
MEYLSDAIGSAQVLLQLVLLYLIVRGPFRRYFLIFAYCLAQTVQTVVDGAVLRKFGVSSNEYKVVFWTDAITVDILLFFVVIAVTYQALEGSPLQKKMTRLLMIISGVIVILPFVVLKSRIFYTRWFNGTDQILNFGIAILNLFLWTALLGNKKRDPQLLTVTAGLGARVAATALLLGLRQFTEGGGIGREIADTAARLSIVVGTLIWCWAFRPSTRPKKPAPAAIQTAPL